MKEKELLARLDKTKSIQASLAAKPVPKVEKYHSFEPSLNLIYRQNILTRTEAENTKGRDYTVGIAVAGSILDNAQTQEMRTYLAG